MLDRLGFASMAHERVGRLPLGWKQKLAFSVALLHEPEVVFLDEPTGGVDPVTRRQFWELIYAAAAGGTTVFVTTHYMDEAEYCDRVSIMVAGRIAALGTPGRAQGRVRRREHGRRVPPPRAPARGPGAAGAGPQAARGEGEPQFPLPSTPPPR